MGAGSLSTTGFEPVRTSPVGFTASCATPFKVAKRGRVQGPRSAFNGRRRRRAMTAVSATAGDDRSNKGLGVLEWTGSLIPQGTLVKGVKAGWKLAWQTMMRELAPQGKDGSYKRPAYNLTSRVGDPQFPVESDRYVVYVGNACPWCHRVVLMLVLRGLTRHIAVVHAVDDAERASRGGWVFDSPEPVFGKNDLREVYDAAIPGYRGRCTAPLLVDRRARRAVSNESADIVRMLNGISLPGCSSVDLYPPQLAPQIDALNELIYDKVNNGTYKSGFATTQAAYDNAQRELYSALDHLESVLGRHRFLAGERFTEVDLRLFPTLIRYDAVYTTLFKCWKRIADYPYLSGWLRDVYQLQSPGPLQVRDTFSLEDARRSYFGQLFPLNPSGIVPTGPSLADLGLDRDSGRGSEHRIEALAHAFEDAMQPAI